MKNIYKIKYYIEIDVILNFIYIYHLCHTGLFLTVQIYVEILSKMSGLLLTVQINSNISLINLTSQRDIDLLLKFIK